MPRPGVICSFVSIVTVLIGFSVGTAQASVLSPGQTAAPDLLTPGGTRIAFSTGFITVSGPVGFTAFYDLSVFSDPGNHFCSGCLDFTYQFRNSGGNVITRFATSWPFSRPLADYMVDVGYNPTTSGLIPLTVDRSPGGIGGNIGFNYPGSDAVGAGQMTRELVIETNAPFSPPPINGSLQMNAFVTACSINCAGRFAFDAITPPAPPPVVPEPSSLALLGAGLLPVIGVIRRRYLNH